MSCHFLLIPFCKHLADFVYVYTYFQVSKCSLWQHCFLHHALKFSYHTYTYANNVYCSGGICSDHRSCLSCQLDIGCGWCPTIRLCVSRSNSSLSAAECGTDDPHHWLITGTNKPMAVIG